ncbi:MAG: hypothetical protein ACRC9K_12115 [Afipia sp.]
MSSSLFATDSQNVPLPFKMSLPFSIETVPIEYVPSETSTMV